MNILRMRPLIGIVTIVAVTAAIKWPNEKIYDLTWSFNNKTIFWNDGRQTFEFTKNTTKFKQGFRVSFNEFHTSEHGGTHFDAPFHFNPSGWRVNEVPVERLIAKGAFIDVTQDYKQYGRDARLTVKHLENWERRNGKFQDGSVLLVRFGLSNYWPNRNRYLDLDENNIMHFPGLSRESAQWIAASGKFYGIGLDTPSVDPGNSTDSIVHRIFSNHSMFNLENVKLLMDLPETGFDLIVAPMKIENGTGAPARILAIVN